MQPAQQIQILYPQENLKKQPDNINSFKQKHPFEKRKLESERIMVKYPTRIPIIVERYSKGIQQIDKKKYLAPEDLSMANFLYVIRKILLTKKILNRLREILISQKLLQ